VMRPPTLSSHDGLRRVCGAVSRVRWRAEQGRLFTTRPLQLCGLPLPHGCCNAPQETKQLDGQAVRERGADDDGVLERDELSLTWKDRTWTAVLPGGVHIATTPQPSAECRTVRFATLVAWLDR